MQACTVKRTTVICKRPLWSALDLRPIWTFKDLFVALVEKDLKLRYRQTLLGAAWILLQPLLGAAIFSMVFHNVAHMQANGNTPYFLFAFSGMVCWGAFSTSFVRSSASVMQNANLVSKVYFPRIILPMSAGVGSLVDFAVSYVVLLIVVVASKMPVGGGLLIAPLWALVATILGVGLGAASGALMVWYRDVQYIVPVAVQFLLYASPVAYSADKAIQALPPNVAWLYMSNPVAGIIESFRDCLLGQPVSSGYAVYAVLASLITFALGAVLFTWLERYFADVI